MNNVYTSLLSVGIGLGLTSCSTLVIEQYEATAKTTLTWQVNYQNSPTENKLGRFEEFESTALINRNGEKPQGAVSRPDDEGLWWPILPPKPTLDDIENRQKTYEKPGKPELLRRVQYQLIYQEEGETMVFPTNAQVYRQVVKAYPNQTPLKLTLGIQDNSVEKAEPIVSE